MIFNPKNKKITFLIFVLIFNFAFLFNFADGYSIDDPGDSFNNPAKSLFKQNPLQFSPIDITKFIKGDPSKLTFRDLVNLEAFSTNDIKGSIKAVLTLFIRLNITTLNVTLGILKVLLDILTSRF